MYAITGITGKVGGTLARELLASGQQVRAILRDPGKAREWLQRACEVAYADMQDVAALATAFTGAEAVFILPPSEFDPAPGYPEARQVINALVEALNLARPRKVLSLSTVGADAAQDNLLTQRTMLEQALSLLPMPVTFLRPGWFMENSLWDVAGARRDGVIHSFLQPLHKRFPMVATEDVGRVAAQLMQQEWTGVRIAELEGPQRVSPEDIARAFSVALAKPVRVEAVPRSNWEGLFHAQGARNPWPRARMLDGFNEGWIDFRDAGAHAIKGRIGIEEVVARLVHQT